MIRNVDQKIADVVTRALIAGGTEPAEARAIEAAHHTVCVDKANAFRENHHVHASQALGADTVAVPSPLGEPFAWAAAFKDLTDWTKSHLLPNVEPTP